MQRTKEYRYKCPLFIYQSYEVKALTEHVSFTCSYAYELFMMVVGTMGGRRVRGASVTGTVMTVLSDW